MISGCAGSRLHRATGLCLSAFVTLEVCRAQLSPTGAEFVKSGDYITLRITSIIGFSYEAAIEGENCVRVLTSNGLTLYVDGDKIEERMSVVTRAGR